MAARKTLYVTSRDDWRDWLTKHCRRRPRSGWSIPIRTPSAAYPVRRCGRGGSRAWSRTLATRMTSLDSWTAAAKLRRPSFA